MLYEAIMNGFGIEEDYNCAETIIYGANEVYGLGLDKKNLRLAGGFGGGMGVQGKCGAVIAGIMVLGSVYNETVAHQSPELKTKVVEYQRIFEERMGSTICDPLTKEYRTEKDKCKAVILAAAKVLDEMVKQG